MMIKKSNYDIFRHFSDKKGLFSPNFNQNLKFLLDFIAVIYFTQPV